MNEVVVKTPMQYLDQALGTLRELNLLPTKQEDAPIVALLEKISDIEPDKVAIITRTLQQMSVFNEAVRDQISQMSVGNRYESIAKSFDSIRDDAQKMVEQLDDGRIDLFERVTNVWMKISRGDIADRFDSIFKDYLAVSRDTKENIRKESMILQAYQDFRGALKHGQIAAYDIMKAAEEKLGKAKEDLEKAANAVASFPAEKDISERALLELKRDEAIRHLQNAESRYQIAKDLSDNLSISYNTSEVVMARLIQTTNAKERVYQQSISFFTTNESVFTALKATFTGLFGLHETTQTLNVMKEGTSRSLEVLAEIGGKVQEEALKAGYGPTIRVDAVKKLVDSVVAFQERSTEIVDEMRTLATKNSEEIRDAVEDGKKRMARLAAQGNVLELSE